MKLLLPFMLLFPFLSSGQSPGAVDASRLVLWNKADAGVTATAQNVVRSWKDQAMQNRFVAKGQPRIQEAGLNYNPVISFTGLNRLEGTDDVHNITQVFAVAKIGGPKGALLGILNGHALHSHRYFFHTEDKRLYSIGNHHESFTSFNYGSNRIPFSIFMEDAGKRSAGRDVMRLNGVNKKKP